MTLQSHFWAYIQRKTWPQKIPALQHSCSTIYNSQDMETTSTSIDRGMDEDMVHTDSGILLSLQKEKRSFAATCEDLESVILCEVSKTEKEKYHMTSFITGI